MRALTIAGSDPSGGGGIQRDLMTFAALGISGTSCLSSLTAQNTNGVVETLAVSGTFLARQIETLLVDLPPDASKTGLLPSAEAVSVVASFAGRLGPLVVDPVLASTGGQTLVEVAVPEALRAQLLPLTALVTPNLAEAEALTGVPVTDADSMAAAGRALLDTGVGAVLIKGGHLAGDPIDLLLTEAGAEKFSAPRLEVPDVRGTGCALSAAIATGLARGLPIRSAVVEGRRFVRDLLRTAAPVGSGAWHLGEAT